MAEFGDRRLPARFWSKVRVSSATGCWDWTAQIHTAGYGIFRIDGRQTYAHRVVAEYLKGGIPSGLVIDHLCRNRACVHPLHLEITTQQVNVLRGEAPEATRRRHAARTHCKQGHLLSEGNLTGETRRRCRTCQNEAAAKTRRKRATSDSSAGEG